MQQFKKNRVCVCGVGGGAVSEFPSGPVIRSQCFHSCGPGSIPGWGTTIPQASWCGKKKKKEKNKSKAAEISTYCNSVYLILITYIHVCFYFHEETMRKRARKYS